MTTAYKYLFGPVNSRRLGISLGIDVIPYKTCSFNCVYCECGATTALTTRREEYVPAEEVIKEFDAYLSSNPELDVITFSGSGEPTLYSKLGELISYLKKNYPQYQVAVLTNSSLLWMREVRNELLPADIVIPTFNAVSLDIFRKIARPPHDICVENIIDGLIAFGQEYEGILILEVFIIPGINTTEEELQKIKNICEKIRPSLIQINSLDRPGAVKWVEAVSEAELKEIQAFFQPLPVQVIGKPSGKRQVSGNNVVDNESILATLRRRPSTAEDLQVLLGISSSELLTMLESLIKNQRIISVTQHDRIFYTLAPSSVPQPKC